MLQVQIQWAEKHKEPFLTLPMATKATKRRKIQHRRRYMSDSLCLQADLDSLCEWSHQWKLSFKEEKCALLSFCRRHRPVSSSYTICHQPIALKSSHSDLGVVASADLSWSAHYDHLASQAYKLIGLLRRTFQSTDSISAKKQLYTSLVRPRLLYCSQLWRPHLIKDILRLEKIQRRVTKFILNDYVSDYRSRLSQLNLLPLMSEFELNDMMFCIKCLKFPARHFDINQFITFSANSTRSGTHGRMTHSHSSSNISRHSYFLRLPRLWNSFPPVDINQSLSSIKSRLMNVLFHHFTSHFNPDCPCTFHSLCPCSSVLNHLMHPISN